MSVVEIPSAIENREFSLIELERKLKPLGYTIGGDWDYDSAFFDYKIDDNGAYQYLRVPIFAVKGEIGSRGAIVRLGRPFLLAHEYRRGLDDQVMGYNALMNQFSEPHDKDAEVEPKYVSIGKSLVKELEATLLF